MDCWRLINALFALCVLFFCDGKSYSGILFRRRGETNRDLLSVKHFLSMVVIKGCPENHYQWLISFEFMGKTIAYFKDCCIAVTL